MKMDDLLLWGGLAALGILVFSSSASAADPPFKPPGGRNPDPDPKFPGTGPIIPGPRNEGPPPLPTGWGGGQYGSGPIPGDFDWGGNRLYISDDCATIAEGLRFLPIPGGQEILHWWMPINGGPPAAHDLPFALGFIAPHPVTNFPLLGTAWGLVARLVARAARDGKPIDAHAIASQVFHEAQDMQTVLPFCDEMPVENWPKPLKDWWRNFEKRIEIGIKAFRENWYVWNEFWEVS